MPDTPQPTLPLAPDFTPYRPGPALAAITCTADMVSVIWEDGLSHAFNSYFLRENEVQAGIVNPVTRERDIEIDELPEDLQPISAEVDEAGALTVTWAPDDHESRHHPGWLRAIAEGRWRPNAGFPAPVTWDADTMPEPPTFNGPAVMDSDAALYDWLHALATFGLARLEGLPTENGTVEKVARRIGTVRASNFGFLFTVESKSDPDSNAYTSAALTGHTDLASREVQPGLQLLHCQENSCSTGHSTMVDGFKIAEVIRDEDPELFRALTDLNWLFSNRHPDSDFRWSGPIVETDPDGSLTEIRNTSFLRANPDMPDSEVPRAYRAVRRYAALARQDRFTCATLFRPGDCVIFNNRRMLHGRSAFDPSEGNRRLEGCYLETDELLSRLRVLTRSGHGPR